MVSENLEVTLEGEFVVYDNLIDHGSVEATQKELEQITDLIVTSLIKANEDNHYDPELWERYVDKCRDLEDHKRTMEKTYTVLYKKNGVVKGMGMLQDSGEEGALYARFLYVSPELHGKGIGKEIVNIRDQRARDFGADRLTGNSYTFPSTLAFHEKRGWTLGKRSIIEPEYPVEVVEMARSISS